MLLNTGDVECVGVGADSDDEMIIVERELVLLVVGDLLQSMGGRVGDVGCRDGREVEGAVDLGLFEIDGVAPGLMVLHVPCVSSDGLCDASELQSPDRCACQQWREQEMVAIGGESARNEKEG